MNRIVLLIAMVGAAAFCLGWQSHGKLEAKELTIRNTRGRVIATIREDSDGNGVLAIYDRNGAITDSLGGSASQVAPGTAGTLYQPGAVMEVMSIDDRGPSKDETAIEKKMKETVDRLTREVDAARRALGSNNSSERRNASRNLRRLELEKRKEEQNLSEYQERIRGDRQRVVGWDGDRIVILWTAENENDVLRQVRLGDFVAWKGERLQMDTSRIDFLVTELTAATKPPGFPARSDKVKIPSRIAYP